MRLPLSVSPEQEAVALLVQHPGALVVANEGEGGETRTERGDDVVTLHNGPGNIVRINPASTTNDL